MSGVSHSLHVELENLKAKKLALEISLLKHPGRKEIIDELKELEEHVKQVKDTMANGQGLEPSWR